MLRRLMRISGGLLGVMAFCSSLVAQNTRPSDTPKILQIDEGPDDSGLPNAGKQYCGPTSMTMNLFWLASKGFTTVAPEFSKAAGYNLDLVLGGLAGTTPTGGTTAEQLVEGLSLYLSLKGLAGGFTSMVINAPTLEDLDGHFDGNTMLATEIGWFTGTNGTYTRTSGHFVSLLDFDSTTNIATINNSAPHTLYNVAATLPNVRQTPEVAPLDPALNIGLSGTFQQYITPTYPGGQNPPDLAVIEGLVAIEVTAMAGGAAATFTATTTLRINTNGGSFSAEAALAGTGGIEKSGVGVLTLTAANDTTGKNFVSGGTLASTLTTNGSGTATPFGTGAITLSGGGALSIIPEESTAPGVKDVFLAIASGTDSSLSVIGGAGRIELNAGANDSLTVYGGGENDGATPNLVREANGTLTLSVVSGFSDLGGRVKFLVSGSGGNLPEVRNGMVTPGIVGVDADAGNAGAFLTYGEATGFQLASVTSGSSFSGAGASTVFATAAAIDLGSGQATVAALEASHAVTGEADSVLSILPDGAFDAGVILNNAIISTGTLSFGAKDAYVYAGSGTNEIQSVIQASGDFVTFGSGEVVVSGTASAIQGGIFVNDGKLTVQNRATGTAAVTVRTGATLGISGSTSVVAGAVSVEAGATLAFDDHGRLTGDLTLPSRATVQGNGVVEFASTLMISGNIGDGIHSGVVEFLAVGSESVVLDGTTSIFRWTLNEATDDPAAFGTAWGGVIFDAAATVGSTEAPLSIELGFAEGLLPNDGDAFWDENHNWKLFAFNSEFSSGTTVNTTILNNIYTRTYGSFATSLTGDTLWLNYTALPEPSAALLLTGSAAMLMFVRRRQGGGS